MLDNGFQHTFGKQPEVALSAKPAQHTLALLQDNERQMGCWDPHVHTHAAMKTVA